MSVDLDSSHLDTVVLVNALAEEGRMPPATVSRLVRTARTHQPDRTVIVLLDHDSPAAVRAAREAGADDFLGRDDLDNEEAVYWRFSKASASFHQSPMDEGVQAVAPAGQRPLRVRRSAPLSSAARRKADAAIEAAVGSLPAAEERRKRVPDLMEVVAPGLRNPDSGRLDARRIAEATGLSIAALARACGVSQQSLSATPDSPGAQPGLLPIARISEMLDEMFTPEHKRVWLQTPHPRFDGRSPIQAIEGGDAELVALSVASALEGHPD